MSQGQFYEGINVSFLDSLPDGARLLDYGCGRGYVSRFLVTSGFHVVAADIDPSCEQSLRSGLSATENSRLQFLIIDKAGPLPDFAGQFDAIICREVLEHVPAPSSIIRVFSDVLVEGGLLVLSVPSLWSERYFSFWDPYWLDKSEHLRVFRKAEIRSLLHSSMMLLVRVEGQSFRWSLFWIFLAPFRVKHKMGNPQSHGNLVQAVYKLTEKICSFSSLVRAGNRFLPKSYFYYAVKRKPRILVVFDYPDWVLGSWAENIRKLYGSEFDIITMSMFQADADKAYAADLIRKVDIVHLLLPHAHRILRNYLSGKAVISTVHHWVEWEEFYSCTIQNSDHIVTGAVQWQQRLIEKGVPAAQITVIHSGVSEHFFLEHPPLLPPSTKLTCGFFAKMDSNELDRKGSRHLLRLVDSINKADVGNCFRLVISGPGWQEHVAAIQDAGVETVYIPFVAEKEMPALFRSLDVYLMLSDVEGGPVTIAEAMASGCMVFSTSVGVAKEIVQDNVTGRVVDTADPEDILSKLLEYYTHPERSHFVIDQARRLAHETLRYEHTMFPLRQLYRDLLRSTKLPGEGQLDSVRENLITAACAAKVRVGSNLAVK